jgi:hypothetical protein
MIECLTGFPPNVVAFRGHGQVTRQDYQQVLIPAVEHALQAHGKVRLYYEIGADFTGMDAGAMLDDFGIGVEHLLHWERIAVVTDVGWVRHAAQAFVFLMPRWARLFGLAEAEAARRWISSQE